MGARVQVSVADREAGVLDVGEEELETIRRRMESVTPREREVLDLALEGKLNKNIAREAGIGQRPGEAQPTRKGP